MSLLFKSQLRIWKALIRRKLDEASYPEHAKEQSRVDKKGVSQWSDPGTERVIIEGLRWLIRAQVYSTTHDGGVARHFSLIDGWGPSYPETTGYIVPTLLDHAATNEGELGRECRESAERMLDWFLEIQTPCGGFQGGTIDARPIVPVTFNTGQILMGLASGVRVFGTKYESSMHRAASWLVESLDSDGCWRKHPTPFAEPGEKAYETHVAWGLLEAARVSGEKRYATAALTNVNWALTKQQSNGWFASCCLNDPVRPLTHTIGYALRGLIEAHLYFDRDPKMLAAARLTGDGLLMALRPDGSLPGRLDSSWKGVVSWCCLTGSSQLAHCLLLLGRETGDHRYLNAARSINSYVRKTVAIEGPEEVRGAVRGSLPINGAYGYYQYLNWACKFTVDSNSLELELSRTPGHG